MTPKSRLQPHGDFILEKRNTRKKWVWVHSFHHCHQPTRSNVRDQWGDGQYRLIDEDGTREIFTIDRMACIKTDPYGREIDTAGSPQGSAPTTAGSHAVSERFDALETMFSQYMERTEQRWAAMEKQPRTSHHNPPPQDPFAAVRTNLGRANAFMKDLTELAGAGAPPPEDATAVMGAKILGAVEKLLADQSSSRRAEHTAAQTPQEPPFLAQLEPDQRHEVEMLVQQLGMTPQALATAAAFYGLDGVGVVDMLRALAISKQPQPTAQAQAPQPTVPTRPPQPTIPTTPPPAQKPELAGMTPEIESELRSIAKDSGVDWREAVAMAHQHGIDAPTALMMARKHMDEMTTP